MNEETIRKTYITLIPSYEKLGINLKQVLEFFLDEAKIEYLSVTHRTKNIDSILEKIKRKGYKNPLVQLEDVCAIRIICYYVRDIQKITDTIEKEFEILASEDKEELLNPDQFGYRSHHHIVTIKKNWLKVPPYRSLDNIKAEIQVRTILMHAWAEIEHKLAYKKIEDIQKEFQGKFGQLSAILKNCDTQFEELKDKIIDYRHQLVEKAKKQDGVFDVDLPMNLDNLQAFLDFCFPERIKNIEDTGVLLKEIVKNEISMKKLVASYLKVKEFLPAIEKEEIVKGTFGKMVTIQLRSGYLWAQTGAVRRILDLTNDRYFKSRSTPSYIRELNIKWIKILLNKIE